MTLDENSDDNEHDGCHVMVYQELNMKSNPIQSKRLTHPRMFSSIRACNDRFANWRPCRVVAAIVATSRRLKERDNKDRDRCRGTVTSSRPASKPDLFHLKYTCKSGFKCLSIGHTTWQITTFSFQCSMPHSRRK